MEPIVWLFVVIAGIGVIIAGLLGFVAVLAGWWFIIPIACAAMGGWIGFFFGLGLVAVIGFILLAVKNDGE